MEHGRFAHIDEQTDAMDDDADENEVEVLDDNGNYEDIIILDDERDHQNVATTTAKAKRKSRVLHMDNADDDLDLF